MTGLLFIIALVLLPMTPLQTAVAKEKPQTVLAQPIPKGAMAFFGYPGAKVLHHAMTDEGIHNFVFSTTDPIEKVAAHYEKNTFFIDSDLFRKELHDHPTAGRYYNPAQFGVSVFYYRNPLGGLCYYAVGTRSGLTVTASVSVANGITYITVHRNGSHRSGSGDSTNTYGR